MSKLGDAFRDGRIVGAVVIVGIMGAVGAGTFALATSANAEQAPAAVVESVEAVDYGSLPYTNGLAGEQESEAATLEAARVAAEAAAAEAARVAAEQAAQAEAERIATEQVAESFDEPADEPAAEDPWASKIRVPWIPSDDPQNAAGGDWDMSVCPNGSASTGPDGVPYCD